MTDITLSNSDISAPFNYYTVKGFNKGEIVSVNPISDNANKIFLTTIRSDRKAFYLYGNGAHTVSVDIWYK